MCPQCTKQTGMGVHQRVYKVHAWTSARFEGNVRVSCVCVGVVATRTNHNHDLTRENRLKKEKKKNWINKQN